MQIILKTSVNKSLLIQIQLCGENLGHSDKINFF
jgi:hypothetical protein